MRTDGSATWVGLAGGCGVRKSQRASLCSVAASRCVSWVAKRESTGSSPKAATTRSTWRLLRERRQVACRGMDERSAGHAWVHGDGQDYFIVVNFGGWSGCKSLSVSNLPHYTYRELWNSTWPAFQVEWEDEPTNGGRDARSL
jgi:hypothetical protein